jgi:hypothetical protein
MRSAVKMIVRVISLAALVATIAPAVLFFEDRLDLLSVHSAMLVATVAWFASASLWIRR